MGLARVRRGALTMPHPVATDARRRARPRVQSAGVRATGRASRPRTTFTAAIVATITATNPPPMRPMEPITCSTDGPKKYASDPITVAQAKARSAFQVARVCQCIRSMPASHAAAIRRPEIQRPRRISYGSTFPVASDVARGEGSGALSARRKCVYRRDTANAVTLFV